MRFFRLWAIVMAQVAAAAADAPPLARPVESILADYVKAVGGYAAVDRLTSRETVAGLHHGPRITLYWQKPNQVLSLTKKERIGFDGTRGWTLSSKRKIKKLAHGAEVPIEMDANPLRFVHIRDFYSELDPSPPEELDGEKMEVIVAPNNLSATKLYFDAATHLLRLVDENGEVSAYFKNKVEFLDYQEVDGVRLPFRILHTTTEPGGASEDLRIKKITHNLQLQPEIFSKPLAGQMVMGGKR
jgi:hypothetical protein